MGTESFIYYVTIIINRVPTNCLVINSVISIFFWNRMLGTFFFVTDRWRVPNNGTFTDWDDDHICFFFSKQ